MQVAQAKGLPSLKHHLLPRTKGFAVTVRSLRNVGKDDPAGPPAAREGTPAPRREPGTEAARSPLVSLGPGSRRQTSGHSSPPPHTHTHHVHTQH